MVFGHYNADMCTYYNVAVIEFAHGLGSQLKILSCIKICLLFVRWLRETSLISYFLSYAFSFKVNFSLKVMLLVSKFTFSFKVKLSVSK